MLIFPLNLPTMILLLLFGNSTTRQHHGHEIIHLKKWHHVMYLRPMYKAK